MNKKLNSSIKWRKSNFFLLLTLVILVSWNSSFNLENSERKYSISLKDGKEVRFNEYVDYFEESFSAETTLPVLNSAIIRAFETPKISIQDLKKYVVDISENIKIGYWNIIPNQTVSDFTYSFPLNNSGYDWSKIEVFSNFYHELFQNKSARNYLFDQALDFVSNLCIKYPSDFQKRVLMELDDLNNFLILMNNPNNKVNTDEISDYWKGFVFRRHANDGISISEMQALISKAKLKIKSIDKFNQPDCMYEFCINNQISFFASGENDVLYSKISRKRIVLPKNVNFWKVKFLKDETGDYYLFSGDDDKPKYLYNEKLEKIN